MSVAAEVVEGAAGPVKKVLSKKGAPNKLAYVLGLLVFMLVVIRFRTQILGLLSKIPVLGPMLAKVAGA